MRARTTWPVRLALSARLALPAIHVRMAALLFTLAAAALGLNAAPPQALELDPTQALYRIDTPGFTIYYPAALESRARDLAGFADAERARIAALFGIPDGTSGGRRKIPVLLTDTSPWLNGYLTMAPSERLVIQLAPAPWSGELSSMRDELRDVFTHELTHALTSGLRGPLWSALAFLFGDPIEPTGWMVPSVISEGTSVLAESSRGEGRLNDPSAAARMRIDAARRTGREFWETNGTLPYAGSLYHLYGGPFADYLVRRFGPETIGRLWVEGSKGNFFAGFDGSFFPGGIFRTVTGAWLEDVWRDFLDSIRLPDIAADMALARRVPGSGRFVTALAARGGILYWVDAESGAAFRLDSGSRGARPERLFAADGAVGDIGVSADGTRLLVEWVRQGPGGRWSAVVREFDLASRRFVAEYPAPGSGIAGLAEGSRALAAAYAGTAAGSAEPRLARVTVAPERGIEYGLVRIGARLYAARRPGPGGALEVLDARAAGLGAVMAVAATRDLVAVMHAGDNGVPRIALFTEKADSGAGGSGGGGRQDAGGGLVPRGDIPGTMGAFWQMALVDAGHAEQDGRTADTARPAVAFARLEPDGGRQLMIAPIAPFASVAPTRPEELASTRNPAWIPWRMAANVAGTAGPAPGNGASAIAQQREAPGSAGARRAILPLAGRSYRVPLWENETLSLRFTGQDLTGFLSWQAEGGWDFAGGGPEAALAAQADFGRHELGFSFSDRLRPTALGTWRRSDLGVLSFSGTRQLRPVNRWFGYGADAALSLSGDAAPAGTSPGAQPPIWSADRDRAAAGASLWTGYSTMRASYFAPWDPAGWSLFGGTEIEWAPWALPGAAGSSGAGAGSALPTGAPQLSLSATGHASVRPLGLDARIAGAVALSPDLRFSPAYRILGSGAATSYSILGTPWPSMAEYAADPGRSPWMAYGELSARAYLAARTPHADRPRGLRLPLRFASLTLRPGIRAALYQPGAASLSVADPAALALPASAFLRATARFAPLVGLSAQGSVTAAAEVAWILDPDRAGGSHVAFSFGSSVGLQ